MADLKSFNYALNNLQSDTEALIQQNMATDDVADYILSQLPRGNPRKEVVAEDFDDFDHSLTADGRLPYPYLPPSSPGQLSEAYLPKPYFKEDMPVNGAGRIVTPLNATKYHPSVSVPGGEKPSQEGTDIAATLGVFKYFISRMDAFYAQQIEQNRLHNQYFADMQKYQYDERKLLEVLDLKLSEYQKASYVEKSVVLSQSRGQQKEVYIKPQYHETEVRNIFKSHTIVEKEKDDMIVKNEGFVKARVNERKYESAPAEQRAKKRHRKHDHYYVYNAYQPFYPVYYYPVQFLPFAPWYPGIYGANLAQQQQYAVSPTKQVQNEFTSYHEPKPRKQIQKKSAISPIVSSEIASSGVSSPGKQINQLAKQQYKRLESQIEHYVPEYQNDKQESKQGNLPLNSYRQYHEKYIKYLYAEERYDSIYSTDAYLPFENTSLGEIFPKYDAKQANKLAKTGQGIGAYDTSVFSNWDLSSLYSSSISEGEVRKNFAHVYNYK